MKARTMIGAPTDGNIILNLVGVAILFAVLGLVGFVVWKVLSNFAKGIYALTLGRNRDQGPNPRQALGMVLGPVLLLAAFGTWLWYLQAGTWFAARELDQVFAEVLERPVTDETAIELSNQARSLNSCSVVMSTVGSFPIAPLDPSRLASTAAEADRFESHGWTVLRQVGDDWGYVATRDEVMVTFGPIDIGREGQTSRTWRYELARNCQDFHRNYNANILRWPEVSRFPS